MFSVYGSQLRRISWNWYRDTAALENFGTLGSGKGSHTSYDLPSATNEEEER